MPCCAGAQVVGDKHDVEEGAPVLKKTVFGERLKAAVRIRQVSVDTTWDLQVDTLTVPAVLV